jgi:branched-chain amino acid transport system substrate-binding protein
VVLAYKREYEARFKSDVSTFGGHAYDGLMIAVEALKKAGGTDKARVRDAIESVRGFMGTAGAFNFSPADHVGLDVAGFRMLEIRKGDWTLAR